MYHFVSQSVALLALFLLFFTGQSLVVKVNLKEESFTPGKKCYDRVQTNLKEALKDTFDVIVSWESPGEKICPSSVAAWFNSRGYDVSVCQQQYYHRPSNDIQFPILDQLNNGTSTDPKTSLLNFFDWYGYFSTGCDLSNTELRELISWTKNMKEKTGQVQYVQYTGFFTYDRLKRVIEAIQDYANTRKDLPWCCIDIHGFVDSPTNLDLNDHMFYVPASDNLTILLHPESNDMIIRRIEPTVSIRLKTQTK